MVVGKTHLTFLDVGVLTLLWEIYQGGMLRDGRYSVCYMRLGRQVQIACHVFRPPCTPLTLPFLYRCSYILVVNSRGLDSAGQQAG